MPYVSEYGNWGYEAVLLFDEDDLTAKQLETLAVLSDYDRLPYVMAIKTNQDTSHWEE